MEPHGHLVFASLGLPKASPSRLLPGLRYLFLPFPAFVCTHFPFSLSLRVHRAPGGSFLAAFPQFFPCLPPDSVAGSSPHGLLGILRVDKVGSKAHSVALMARPKNQARS